MDKKPRGVKKGETPAWKVGRKSIDEKEKSINRSVTLPKKIWAKLDEKAQERGKKGNQLAAEIIKKFYELF